MYTLKINSLDTNRLLEHVKEHHSVFMFEIYGDAETIPTPESSWGRVNPAGVRSSYFFTQIKERSIQEQIGRHLQMSPAVPLLL